MFGGGDPGCTARVAAEFGLAVGRCGCAGYTTDAAAFAESAPIIDVVELRLRQPGEETLVVPSQLAPVRDLLDEGRRRRGPSEDEGVPWRPTS
jgi:hypothetical protein